MNSPEPFAQLLRRYGDGDDSEPAVIRTSLSEALTGGADPEHILSYFRNLGHPVGCLADLLALNQDPGEDDLHAFVVAEGVAVSIVSDGTWILFTP